MEIFRRHGFRKGEATTIGGLGHLARMQGDADHAVTLLEQSAALAAQVGHSWWEARTLADLAELELAQDRPEKAATRAGQALRLSQWIGDRQLSVYVLAFLARAAAEDGDTHRAGRLWGAVEAEEARRPLGAWEGEREQYAARVLAHADAHLEQGLRGGRELPLQAAIEEALGRYAVRAGRSASSESSTTVPRSGTRSGDLRTARALNASETGHCVANGLCAAARE